MRLKLMAISTTIAMKKAVVWENQADRERISITSKYK